MAKIPLKKNLLLFEDDQGSADLVQFIFEKRGYTVNIRPIVDNYIQDIANFQPAVVLLDLRIPSLGGEIVCRNIKMSYDVPVILYSADYNLKEISKRANADDYIQKPYRITELVEAVEKQYYKVVDGSRENIEKPPGKI